MTSEGFFVDFGLEAEGSEAERDGDGGAGAESVVVLRLQVADDTFVELRSRSWTLFGIGLKRRRASFGADVSGAVDGVDDVTDDSIDDVTDDSIALGVTLPGLGNFFSRAHLGPVLGGRFSLLLEDLEFGLNVFFFLTTVVAATFEGP